MIIMVLLLMLLLLPSVRRSSMLVLPARATPPAAILRRTASPTLAASSRCGWCAGRASHPAMLPFPHRRDEGMAECLVDPARGFCIVFLSPSTEAGSLKNCTLFVHSKHTFYFLPFTDVRVRFLSFGFVARAQHFSHYQSTFFNFCELKSREEKRGNNSNTSQHEHKSTLETKPSAANYPPPTLISIQTT